MENFKILSSGKFMWDGKEYAAREAANAVAAEYAKAGFEVEIIIEGGKYYVFNRRLATSPAPAS